MLIDESGSIDEMWNVSGDVCGWGWSDAVGAVSDVGGAVLGAGGDAVDGVVDAVDDVVDAAVDAVVDGVTHVVTTAADVSWDAVGESWAASKWVGARGLDMIGNGSALVGPAISFVGEVSDAATLGLADDLLEVVDDTILDGLDEVTGGVIDIDYDGGSLSVDVGIDDVIGIGLSIGEDGLSTESDVFGADVAIGVGDDGLMLDVEAGIDTFPLPYLDAHLEVDNDGNISANGVVQGPYPYPVGDGMVYGKAGGSFESTEEGWMVAGEAEATWYGADGTQIHGEVGISYAETEEGSAFAASAAGSVTTEYGTVSAGAGYNRIEKDGEVLETFEAEANAKGFGLEVSAETKYLGLETDEGSISIWETDTDFDGFDAENLVDLGVKLLGASDVLPDSVDGLVDQLAEGGTGALMENLDQQGLAQVVQGLGETGTSQLIGKLGADGTAGQLIGELSDQAATELVHKAVETGDVGDLLSGLDAEETVALVARLATSRGGTLAPPTEAGADEFGLDDPIPGLDDDLLGAADTDLIPAAGIDDQTAAVDIGDELIPDAVGESLLETTVDAADALEDSMDDLFEGLD